MATITVAGFERVPDDEIAERFQVLVSQLATPQSSSAPAGTTPTIDTGGAPA
jgi:hypothetical protein